MKKIIFTFFVVILFFEKIFSQDVYEYTGVYRWSTAVRLESCDKAGKVIDAVPAFSSSGQLFWVAAISGKDAVIKFLYYTKKDGTVSNRKEQSFYTFNFKGTPSTWSSLSAIDKSIKQYGDNQIYFKVPLSAIASKAVPYKRVNWSLSVGALNFPFKYRFQKGYGDFSGSFNFGTGVGVLIPHDSAAKWNYSILAGFSISQVNIDSVAATRNWNTLQKSNNFSAFSLSIGIMLQNNKVQIGAFAGWDRLSRLTHSQYGWLYQGKPWFSIGLGYTIFSTETKSDKEGGTRQ